MTALQFLEIRFSALSRGDYAAVYDSYHPDAPFLQQFNDRKAYICFAQQQLDSIDILRWSCSQQRTIADNKIEALLVMEISTEGDSQFFYELALLIDMEAGWRYHSAQKLGADDYSGLPDQIDFHHFDLVTQKIRF